MAEQWAVASVDLMAASMVAQMVAKWAAHLAEWRAAWKEARSVAWKAVQ